MTPHFENITAGPKVGRNIKTKTMTIEVSDLGSIAGAKREDAINFIMDRVNLFFDELNADHNSST